MASSTWYFLWNKSSQNFAAASGSTYSCLSVLRKWIPCNTSPLPKILCKALDEATHQYQINEQPVYIKQESMLHVISEQLQADKQIMCIPTSRGKFKLLTPKKISSSLGGLQMREDHSWGSEDHFLTVFALYSAVTVKIHRKLILTPSRLVLLPH